MTIRFLINYNTQWGEEIYICGSTAELGNNELDAALKMQYAKDGLWSGEIKCNPTDRDRIISYKYFIKRKAADGNADSIFFENGPKRKIALNTETVQIVCFDEWQGNDKRAPFLSAPFSEVFYGAKSNPYTQTHIQNRELIIKATIPNIPADCSIQLCGNTEELGNWDMAKAPSMIREEGCRWSYSISAEELPMVIEYKFVFNRTTWENSANRVFHCPQIARHSTVIKENSSVLFPDESSKGYSNNPRYAGCAIPVFSMRTELSHGVGDFCDIKQFTDMMKLCGMKVLQLLPVNDTTSAKNRKDSYPYNCISSFAFHPIYINLLDVLKRSEGENVIEEIVTSAPTEERGEKPAGKLFGGLLTGKRRKEKETEQQADTDRSVKIFNLIKAIKREGRLLNIKSTLDYDDVFESKMRFLKQIYEMEKGNTFAQPEFYTFVKSNKNWLNPYAEFSALRDKNDTVNFYEWKELSVTKEETDFYVFIQYHLHLQMSAAKKHAHENGIIIKGDIPIGVAPHSVEVWKTPELFNTDESAGAPPDGFCKEGQNWGFPTYKWRAMSQDHYSWWRGRLIQMSKYFDAYRLDHILGFFRIWEVPITYRSALMGHFSPAIAYTRKDIAAAMGLKDESECRESWFIDNCTDGALAGTFGKASDSVLIRSVNKNAMEYETLFIEDPHRHRFYYPMIGAKESYAYFSLSPQMSTAYDALYNDFFYTRNNNLWYHNAVNKLQQLIAASNMLACGEDLGMRNPSVTECMKNLHILSLELQTMPKESGVEIGNPADYSYLSVCTTSTHDSETLRMWLGQRLHGKGSDATPAECEKVIADNLASKSMFAILPLQDWLSLSVKLRSANPADERINDPSNPNQYWCFRMPVTVEEVIADSPFCEKVKRLIAGSGR